MPLARIEDLNGPKDEVIRRIKQASTISDIYDDFFLLEEEEGRDRKPGIHASELYPCLRRPVYSLMGTERRPKVSKFWKQRFKVGHAIHSMMQGDFHRMSKRSQKRKMMRVVGKMAEELDCYFEFEDEVTISPEHQRIAAYYKLESHCDGIFTFRDKKTDEVVIRMGLEIKTSSPDEYDKLTGPKHEHVRQGHIYMAALDLPIMWFVYMNKGNQNNTKSKAPYLVIWQPEVWAEVEDRCQQIHLHVENQTMPERTEGIWCEFCPWAYDCKPDMAMAAAQNRDRFNKRNPFKL